MAINKFLCYDLIRLAALARLRKRESDAGQIAYPEKGVNILNYAGFWRRTAASVIDLLILSIITLPLLYLIYGEAYFTPVPEDSSVFASRGVADLFFNYIFPIVFTLFFWLKFAATPGKMALGVKVVDAVTGEKINLRQSIIRYIGYFVATLPLFLGIFWVAFDKRKQGWHDKMAGTAVVRKYSGFN